MVAVVTGASRGLGGNRSRSRRGRATVYVTGRSTTENRGALPGTIDETAAELTRMGGTGIAVRCDHRVDDEVASVFKRVRDENGRLDVLVNNAFVSPDQRVLWSGSRFWEIPIALWDDLIDVGLRSHFVATRFAVPLMIERGGGLVVNVASHASGRGKSEQSLSILPYSVCKAGVHRLTSDMAVELQGTGVAVVSMWPPASRTERVLTQPGPWGDVSDWKPPLFTGRVVAEFAASDGVLQSSGEALVVTDLAEEMEVGD